jgi:hypothetical protein
MMTLSFVFYLVYGTLVLFEYAYFVEITQIS